MKPPPECYGWLVHGECHGGEDPALHPRLAKSARGSRIVDLCAPCEERWRAGIPGDGGPAHCDGCSTLIESMDEGLCEDCAEGQAPRGADAEPGARVGYRHR